MSTITTERLLEMRADRRKQHGIIEVLDKREDLLNKKSKLMAELNEVHSKLNKLHNELSNAGIDNFMYYERGKPFDENTGPKEGRIKRKPKEQPLPNGFTKEAVKMYQSQQPKVAPVIQDLPPIPDVLFFDGIYIPAVRELFVKEEETTPVVAPAARQQPEIATPPEPVIKKTPLIRPSLRPKEIKRVPQLERVEEKPKRFPAVYTNLESPYGLATQMLREQMQEDLRRKTG